MDLFRKMLFPFSLLYGGVTTFRNWLYNSGWLKSKGYNFPVICVGNLSTGGTGKSPMIEFLVSFLKTEHKVAVLSRGYKRKTTGYHVVQKNSTVEDAGDEPLQFKQKFPEITVAVCEDRRTGIEKLQNCADVVLLDDAFQHRKVNPSLNILLTSFDKLYINDCILPAGNLRESKSGAKRAHVIVVTKCPDTIDALKMQEIKRKLKPKPYQEIYFSKIGYGSEIKNESGSKPLEYLLNKEFLLVTGIANPKPLVVYLKNNKMKFREKSFRDHHHFTVSEINILQEHKLILTTEKDFMRLKPLVNKTEIYYLPIKTIILNNAGRGFKKRIEREMWKK